MLVLAAATRWLEESTEQAEDRFAWVAVRDQCPVGFVSARELDHWSGETDAYIGELVVASGHARSGIGSALLAEVEAWARKRGLARIRLTTGAANTAALALYRRRGYLEEEVTLSLGL